MPSEIKAATEDLAAAVSDFEQYFEVTADARKMVVKRDMRAELTKVFISSFRRSYADTGNAFKRAEDSSPGGPGVGVDLVIGCMKSVLVNLINLDSALRNIAGETVQIDPATRKKMTIESVYKHEALVLGINMGTFLAVVDYGIVSIVTGTIEREEVITTIMDLTVRIRNAMKSLGHDVRTTYIAQRIKKIAREKPFLDKAHQKLLAMIASTFAAK